MLLTPTEATDFFTVMAALDLFANQRLNVVAGFDDLEAMRRAPSQARYEIRTAMWADPTVLDQFVRANASGLPAALLADARLFKHAVKGRFFVQRVLKQHAIFVAMSDPVAVYGVEGLTERIQDILSRVQPLGVAIMIDAVLVPFRGRIVWDGLFTVVPILSGPGIRRAFKADYARAKDAGTIVTALGEAPRIAAKPRKATRDWRPAVGEIVAAADGLGKTDTALQAATFAMLKASARLADLSLGDDRDATLDAARKVDRAWRKVVAIVERLP